MLEKIKTRKQLERFLSKNDDLFEYRVKLIKDGECSYNISTVNRNYKNIQKWVLLEYRSSTWYHVCDAKTIISLYSMIYNMLFDKMLIRRYSNDI